VIILRIYRLSVDPSSMSGTGVLVPWRLGVNVGLLSFFRFFPPFDDMFSSKVPILTFNEI
jgi:aspartate oxidase